MRTAKFNESSNLIAQNLRRYRKEQKLSQDMLAAKMQIMGVAIDQQLISKIERNERFVKDYELVCFCKILGVTTQEMLSGAFPET